MGIPKGKLSRRDFCGLSQLIFDPPSDKELFRSIQMMLLQIMGILMMITPLLKIEMVVVIMVIKKV